MDKFDDWFRSIKPDASQKYHQHQAIKDLILKNHVSPDCSEYAACADGFRGCLF